MLWEFHEGFVGGHFVVEITTKKILNGPHYSMMLQNIVD
jgi:hypothetical protein